MDNSNLLAKHGISPEEEQARWNRHRVDQLLAWAGLPLGEKIKMLEGMEEVAIGFGNSFDPATGRLEKRPIS